LSCLLTTLIVSLPGMEYWDALQHFVPARLTQCNGLNQRSNNVLQNLYDELLDEAPSLPSARDGFQWLDLNQFKMNAFVADLLQDRLEEKHGRWGISAQPGADGSLLRRDTILRWVMKNVLGPMFLTEPPSKALGVYTLEDGQFTALTRVHDESGIKIAQFIEALPYEKHWPRV
jgi:hypothetical protein